MTPRFPPDVGGLETYVGWVAETLRDDPRCEVVVVAAGRSPRTRRETFRGVPVVRLGTWGTVSNTPVNPLWGVQLRAVVDRLGADVVNAHAPVPLLADLAAFTSPVPVVLTYHSGSLVKGSSGPVDALLRCYERHLLPRVFDRAAALVAVSPASMAYGDGAHLIPPGVDSSLFRPPCGAAARGRDRSVLYVGRLERTSRWKGTQVLLDALPGLARRVPDVRLGLVGDGDDVPALRSRAVRLGVADRVDWHGRVDHRELPDLYRRAAVTVLPSLTESESFGMALVEAMACGCPVVGSRVGGIPFVVRDGVEGLLVPPGDPAALAGALAAVLTDPARARSMGTAGRAAAVSRWDWARQRERTLEVLWEAGHAG